MCTITSSFNGKYPCLDQNTTRRIDNSRNTIHYDDFSGMTTLHVPILAWYKLYNMIPVSNHILQVYAFGDNSYGQAGVRGPWAIEPTEIYAGIGMYHFRHDAVIKSKHFPCYWTFVRGIHWSPVNSPHKGQRRGALMFSLICTWINGSVNNRKAGDLRRQRGHYDASVMQRTYLFCFWLLVWFLFCFCFSFRRNLLKNVISQIPE